MKKYQRGQSIVEVVIAIALISIILITLVSLATLSIRASTFSRNQTESQRYTQQANEWLQHEKDASWITFKNYATISSTYCLNNPSWGNPGSCGSTEQISGTVFTRSVTFINNADGSVQANVSTWWQDSVGVHTEATSAIYTNWSNNNLGAAVPTPTPGGATPTPIPAGQSISTIHLLNTDTNTLISGSDPMFNGETLNLNTLPANFAIYVDTNPSAVGSVVFNLNSGSYTHTESFTLYCIAGKQVSGVCNAWHPTAGSYTLVVTPWSASGGTGTAGTPTTISFTVTSSGSTPTPTPVATPTPIPAPIAYLKFNEASGATASDSSGHGNIGTWNGTLGSQWGAGKFGGAGNFNGTDNYVAVTEAFDIPIYLQTSYTVSFWINAASQSDKKVYTDRDTTSGNPNFQISVSGAKLRIYIRNAAGATLLDASSTNTVFDSTWHFITFADNNGTAALYFDGALDATSFNYTRTGTFTFNASTIGAQVQGAPTSFFTGLIDDLRMYNYSLSNAQVQYILNNP